MWAVSKNPDQFAEVSAEVSTEVSTEVSAEVSRKFRGSFCEFRGSFCGSLAETSAVHSRKFARNFE